MAHRYSKRTESRESTKTNGEQGEGGTTVGGRREGPVEENPNYMVYRKVGALLPYFPISNHLLNLKTSLTMHW